MGSKKGYNRRDFFKVAATSGVGSALISCTPDKIETLVPRIVPPDDMVIGTPYYFATTCKECPANCAITVKTREGRALTASGNDNHPVTKGGICPVGQSALQGLYNPLRIKSPKFEGNDISWKDAISKLSNAIKKAQGDGKKIVLISNPESGSLGHLLDLFVEEIQGEVLYFDMTPNGQQRRSVQNLFGVDSLPQFEIDQTDALVNFGSDFLEYWNNPVQNANKYAEMHTYKNGVKKPFFHVSSHLNLTGSNADKWLSCLNGTEVHLVHYLIGEFLNKSDINNDLKEKIKGSIDQRSVSEVAALTGIDKKEIINLVKSIENSDRPLAVSGGNECSGEQSYQLHAAVLLLNYVWGSINDRVKLTRLTNQLSSINADELYSQLEKGSVGVVLTHNANIIHALPGGSKNKSVFQKADMLVSLSVSENETTEISQMSLPVNHFLESWGDSVVSNQVTNIQQPVMAKVPGFDSKDFGDIILNLSQELELENELLSSPSFKEFMKSSWMRVTEESITGSFNDFWNNLLRRGYHEKLNPTTPDVELNTENLKENLKPVIVDSTPNKVKLNVFNTVFHNINSQTGDKYWLHEIPDPITQIVWDSWVEINADKAIELGIKHGDEVTVSSSHGEITLGAYVYHGVSKDTVAIPAGYGRKLKFPNYSSRRGMFTPFTSDNPELLKVHQVGVNAMELLPAGKFSDTHDPILSGIEVSIKPTGKRSDFVSLDGQYRDDKEALIADSKAGFGDRSQKSRGILQDTTPEYLSAGGAAHGHQLRERHYTADTRSTSDFYKTPQETVKESIFFKEANDSPKYYDPYKFEMVVDLDKCTGCSSCVVACFAENNVSVVGKERQRLGREMAWIRIERFFDKNEAGEVVTNIGPTMCQQCENAGCEPVCPVYATYHNPDGLNVQVYNRCVGTRYCSNNCIYKQRKFNWRTYEFPYPLNMQLNPDVSVREMGVMEKCTFCVQKIRYAKDIAKDEGRVIQDGEVIPACQSACPTNALNFGNAMDEKSLLYNLKRDERNYHIFEDTNFRPSVTYLKKVRHSKTV